MSKQILNFVRLRLLLSFSLMVNMVSVAHASECAVLNIKHQFDNRGTITVDEPGNYCLMMDLKTKPRFDLHAWSDQEDTPILNIRAANVEVNFKNYILRSSAKYAVKVARLSVLKDGIIKNGIVGVRGDGYASIKKQVYIAKDFPMGTVCRITYPECEDASYLESIDKQPPTYKAKNVTIDNVKVEAKFRGIVLGGGNNIIRNSTIEVDGHTAIFNFGPNPIIENNTIIIHV